MTHCTIIGISDSRDQWFPPQVIEVIAQGQVFSGGKRHHEIMEPLLPQGFMWIDITVPLSEVFQQYEKHDDIIIFASGDPLFFGFAATVQRECPGCEMRVYPSFNSLQMLAHRLCMPYEKMHAVSLTGRPWDKFDEALIRDEELIGCLTDRHKTPSVIWERMQQYGYTNYEMLVGERLGNPQERVAPFDPTHEYEHPSCLILRRNAPRHRPFGLPESEFSLLNGRAKMITKMPIRLCTLSTLDLPGKHSFWDIGFCTGSISIEARLHFPHLHITAFEVREEGRELMQENSRRFGTPGIDAHIGDFLDFDPADFPAPDAVFIGGHGGKLFEMVERIHGVLQPNGCIVFNSVSAESKQTFIEATTAQGMHCTECFRIAVDDHNPITILKAQ